MNTLLHLEKLYTEIGKRPQRKFEETITHFERDIFWYNKDTKNRQLSPNPKKITYADHRRAIETAINIMGKSTQHSIAMCILTDRFFTEYRRNAFRGEGDFTKDYSFLISKIGMIFNPSTGAIKKLNVATKLAGYTKPTIIQINHITADSLIITVPTTNLTLMEWVFQFNKVANESTTYHLAGISLDK